MRDPLLTQAEVVDEGEADVGHRRAVGDGDRQREAAHTALGVQRPVERVDHDADDAAAVLDDAALLTDRGEARARLVQRVELHEDRVLGLLVDDERLVATLAGRAGLDDALAARRMLDEDRAHAFDGPAARAKPIDSSRVRGR